MVERFDPELVFPDPGLSCAKGGVGPMEHLAPKDRKILRAAAEPILEEAGFKWTTPIGQLPEETRGPAFWNASPGSWTRRFPAKAAKTAVAGWLPTAANWECPDCEGARLGPIGRSVILGGKTIDAIVGLSVSEAGRVLRGSVFRRRRDGHIEAAGLGDRLAAEVPRQGRRRLPLAGPVRRQLERGRTPTRPPGDRARQRPGRRLLYSGRTVHRPASPR